MKRVFPGGFSWGTATAAHQIEGGNWNNDWWQWEHTSGSGVAEPSGDACDSWHRWPEDVAICADLGFDNYRFSIEWSRIEPESGRVVSTAAIDHYRQAVRGTARTWRRPRRHVSSLHDPSLARRRGWMDEKPSAADHFADFCKRAAADLGDLITCACTINEPNIVCFMGHAIGDVPARAVGRDSRITR